jgi:hypothetical protein
MLFIEKIAVYSENYKEKPKHTVWVKNAHLPMLQQVA